MQTCVFVFSTFWKGSVTQDRVRSTDEPAGLMVSYVFAESLRVQRKCLCVASQGSRLKRGIGWRPWSVGCKQPGSPAVSGAALWAAYQGCWLKQITSWRCCYVPRLTGPLSKRTSGAPVWILWLKTLTGGDHTPWRKSGENKVYRASEMNVRNLRTAWLFLMKQRCWNSWDWNLVLRKPVETLRRNRQMHKGNWIRNHWESDCNWGGGEGRTGKRNSLNCLRIHFLPENTESMNHTLIWTCDF